MRFITILFLLFAVATVSGQSYEFTAIGTIKDQKFPIDIIKYGDKYFGIESSSKSKFGWTITLDKVKTKNTLQAYDSKLNMVKETELAGGKEYYGPFPPVLKVINEKLVMIYYLFTDKNTVEIWCSTINPEELSTGKPAKILEFAQKNVGLFKAVDLFQSYRLVISSSKNKSRLLFLWYPGNDNTYSFAVTDADMKVIKSASGKIEEATDLIINNTMVDGSGAMYAGFTYKKKGNYYSGLLAGINNQPQKIDIPLGDFSPHDVFVKETDGEEKVRVFGTYSIDGYFINGVFSGILDKKKLQFTSSLMKEIPEGLLDKFDDDGYAKNKKKDKGLFPQIQFVTTDFADGTVAITGDLTRYQTTGSGVNIGSTGVKGTTLNIFFKPDDIIISRIAKKELLGMEKGNNFFLHKWNDKLILFYTDDKNNANTPLDNTKAVSFSSRKDNVLVAATIEKDGRITRQILHPPGNDKLYFSTDDTKSIDDNTLIFGLGKDKIGLTSIKTTSYFNLLTIK